MWSRFDAAEIDEDFARMASLGLEVVRFFLTWETFQPAPLELNARAADDFVTLLDRASAHGLRVMPTLFTGHMSGVNWLPEWTLDRRTGPHPRFRTIAGGRTVPYGIGDFYTGELLEAQRFFARAIGERARDHAAILVWDLGNEFSNLRAPQRPADAAHWAAALAHDLADASNLGTTAGTHGEDLSEDRAIRLSSLCEPLVFGTMHGYPAYSTFARGPADPEVVPFLYDFSGAFAAKRIFFTEFGTPVAPEGMPVAGTLEPCYPAFSNVARSAACGGAGPISRPTSPPSRPSIWRRTSSTSAWYVRTAASGPSPKPSPTLPAATGPCASRHIRT